MKEPKKSKLTVDAIARELGVSKTTVSRALSGKGRISPETRKRVADFVSRAGYEAASEGRLERCPVRNLTLVIPPRFVQLDLPFLRKSMGGVWRMAAQRGYDVLLCYADGNNMEQLERQLAADKMDGVVLSQAKLGNDPCLNLIRKYGVPYVLMGRTDDASVLQVDHDHVGAARDLTRLLLQTGIRRIAYLGEQSGYSVNEDRLRGFRQALEESGAEALVFGGVESEEGRLDALEAALAQKPDCLLCGDDRLAFDLLKDLQRKGIAVPQQLRLASLYDSEILENTLPTITAVQLDAATLGASSCRLLLDVLSGKEISPQPLHGYQVVMRESTK